MGYLKVIPSIQTGFNNHHKELLQSGQSFYCIKKLSNRYKKFNFNCLHAAILRAFSENNTPVSAVSSQT